jgi:heptosyltransferase-2
MQTNGMRRLLIIKTGAAGDVLRTTVLLHLFRDWSIDWFVAKENKELILNDYVQNVLDDSRCIDPNNPYDLVINLEDDESTCRDVLSRAEFAEISGSFIDDDGRMHYTTDSAEWFDMSLISKYGIEKANELKLKNRSSYQQIIFRSLGYEFKDQKYIMPRFIPTSELKGDIAIAPRAGDKWPMKTWCYFEDLTEELSKRYTVNILQTRQTILEHIADIKQHKFVISPDSLPMHLALGLGIPCVAVFTCTSPWEIHDYRLLTKVISPKLEQYFYSREFKEDAVTCIPYQEVHGLILEKLRFYDIQAC